MHVSDAAKMAQAQDDVSAGAWAPEGIASGGFGHVGGLFAPGPPLEQDLLWGSAPAAKIMPVRPQPADEPPNVLVEGPRKAEATMAEVPGPPGSTETSSSIMGMLSKVGF